MASSRSALQSATFDNKANKIANQAQTQNVQNQCINLSVVDTSQHDQANRRRCVCVPFTTVSTYTPRPHLSQELQQKLGKAYLGRGLAHAVAVTGLGGSGKTQLVLHYVEEHKDEYDTILWIDAQDRQTARSSFERCCRALGLPVEPWAGEWSLADVPAVQRVLQWLHDTEQGWLVVVDNADDLSWEVNSIIPHGRTGSVIVTSQDEQASRLPHGSSERLQVDAMETDEAMALFCSAVNLSERDRTKNITKLAQEVIDSLDRLPLAIDLAGARIRSEAEDDGDVEGATRRYLADFARQKQHLLQNEDFAHASSRKKTVWTVWETSLSAIERISQTPANINALELLALMALLDRSGIQDELFRLASLGMEKACRKMNESVPCWLEQVLAIDSDGRWNDTHYRTAVRLLLRFRLVRPISGAWKGVTMHSLVQWRAQQRRNGQEIRGLFLVFVTAICCQMLRQDDQSPFIRHLISHLPTAQQLLSEYNQAEVKTTKHWSRLRGVLSRRARRKMAVHGLTWHWCTVGRVWGRGGRWHESGQLFAASLERRSRTFGRTDPDTNWMKDYLIRTYMDLGRLEEAERLGGEVLQATGRSLGETHRVTLWAKAILAEVYRKQGRLEDAETLEAEIKQAKGLKHLLTGRGV